jgi:uncharacterized membrane protein
MKSKSTIIAILAIFIIIAVTYFPLTITCYGDPNNPKETIIDETEENQILDDINENIDIEEPLEYSDQGDVENLEYIRAKVINIIREEDRSTDYSGGSLKIPTQIVEVAIMEGIHKGETAEAEYVLTLGFSDNYKYSPLKKGNEVLVYVEEDADGTIATVQVVEIARDKYMFYLAAAFVVILILVGGMKGFKAVISLIITAIAILKFLLPAIMKGWDPVLVSVIMCTFVILITMLLISGFNRKTLAAVLGTVGGVLIAGIIAIVVGNIAKLTGIGGDESQMLMYIPQNTYFDFKGLLFAGIIIGTMGANMDVGMSVASSMHEIKKNNPEIKSKDLIKSGMNVGRDIMATMSNTLILAYTGGALHLMLLLMAYNSTFLEIISWDIISSEILRALAGSIGLIITIPLTALISGAVEKQREQ